MAVLVNTLYSYKSKIYFAFTLISFFALLSYTIPDKEWGFENDDYRLSDRILFTFNIHVGIFGYTNPKLSPQSDRARWILFLQRVSSYVFRIVMLC